MQMSLRLGDQPGKRQNDRLITHSQRRELISAKIDPITIILQTGTLSIGPLNSCLSNHTLLQILDFFFREIVLLAWLFVWRFMHVHSVDAGYPRNLNWLMQEISNDEVLIDKCDNYVITLTKNGTRKARTSGHDRTNELSNSQNL